jgi:hypothetical protein
MTDRHLDTGCAATPKRLRPGKGAVELRYRRGFYDLRPSFAQVWRVAISHFLGEMRQECALLAPQTLNAWNFMEYC